MMMAVCVPSLHLPGEGHESEQEDHLFPPHYSTSSILYVRTVQHVPGREVRSVSSVLYMNLHPSTWVTLIVSAPALTQRLVYFIPSSQGDKGYWQAHVSS